MPYSGSFSGEMSYFTVFEQVWVILPITTLGEGHLLETCHFYEGKLSILRRKRPFFRGKTEDGHF